MQIELRDITTIKPYPGNPRQNDGAVDAVANSLREFGWRQPIVIDSDGVIVVGHTRYKAALKLGMTQVPVHVAVGLSPAQIKAYRIADNSTNEIAEWDEQLLPIELSALQEMDFDLNLLGFEDEELQRLLSGGVTPGLTDPDEVPLPPDAATTKPGDLWVLCRLAGLRRGDALALKWSNVNFDDGVLAFRPIKIERFDKQDARVPISSELRQILEAVRKTSLRIDGHVVAQEDVLDSFGRRTFPLLCAKAGITPWNKPLHTLRKSCIDDWCKAAPPNVVMEWATHSALATTMKYYSKVSAADEQIGQRSFLKRPPGPPGAPGAPGVVSASAVMVAS